MEQPDFTNLSNLYAIACDSFESGTCKLKFEFVNYLNIHCRIYQSGKQYVITFTPFDYVTLSSYVRTGVGILTKQDLVDLGNGIGMNRFFHDVARAFVSDITSVIPSKSTIYIAGISMGGSIGLCASYFLHLAGYTRIRITTFGSPRVGNLQLRNWFDGKNVNNYALLMKIDDVRRIDPVCLFPSTSYGAYVNNSLQGIYERKVVPNPLLYVDQEDTDLSLTKIVFSLGFPSSVARLWNEIHTIETYYEALC
jgi:hypothetical protein